MVSDIAPSSYKGTYTEEQSFRHGAMGMITNTINGILELQEEGHMSEDLASHLDNWMTGQAKRSALLVQMTTKFCRTHFGSSKPNRIVQKNAVAGPSTLPEYDGALSQIAPTQPAKPKPKPSSSKLPPTLSRSPTAIQLKERSRRPTPAPVPLQIVTRSKSQPDQLNFISGPSENEPKAMSPRKPGESPGLPTLPRSRTPSHPTTPGRRPKPASVPLQTTTRSRLQAATSREPTPALELTTRNKYKARGAVEEPEVTEMMEDNGRRSRKRAATANTLKEPKRRKV